MSEAAQEPQASPQPQIATETPRELKFRNSWRDWTIRVLTFVVFLFFASGKFKNTADAPWVVLFRQIGFGQWLRYFTGVVEVIGALLLLFSKTVELGLTLLAAVMFGAMVIVVLVLHRPGDAFFAFAFFCGIIAFWLHRRRV
jgi:hypothetical protein